VPVKSAFIRGQTVSPVYSAAFMSTDTSSPAITTESESAPARHPGWFFNPYVQLAVSTLLTASSHVFLKKGSHVLASDAWFGWAALSSPWTWAGIAAMVTSLFSWLYALRFVALNIAFNLAAILHALVPLCGWLFLHETIGLKRGLGIALVVSGVLVIAQAAYEAEEKL